MFFVALHVALRDRQALQQAKRDYLQEFEFHTLHLFVCVRVSAFPMLGVRMFLLVSSLLNPCPS